MCRHNVNLPQETLALTVVEAPKAIAWLDTPSGGVREGWHHTVARCLREIVTQKPKHSFLLCESQTTNRLKVKWPARIPHWCLLSSSLLNWLDRIGHYKTEETSWTVTHSGLKSWWYMTVTREKSLPWVLALTQAYSDIATSSTSLIITEQTDCMAFTFRTCYSCKWR